MAQKETGPKKAPASKLSFGEAVNEVETILVDLERDNVDIDHLGDQVKRAVELIQVCREKLEKTDGEVRELVSGLQDKDADTPDDEDTPF